MGLLDNIKNIPNNPLAMAGLGLLSMPTRSRYGVNPLEYALGGMQAGIQNQQNMTRAKQMEQELAMRTEQYQRETEQYDRARNQEDQIKQYVAQSTDPNLKQIYNVGGAAAATKYLTEKMQPKEPIKVGNQLVDPSTYQPLYTAPTETKEPPQVATYRLTHPEDQSLSGFDAWNRTNKASGATQVNLEKPMTAGDLQKLNFPNGISPQPGMTINDALASGATIKSPEQQSADSKTATDSAVRAQQKENTAAAVERLRAYAEKLGPTDIANPQSRAVFQALSDAAANELAKSRGTPGAEPPAQAIDRARESLPTLNDIGVGAMTRQNIIKAKLDALTGELGAVPQNNSAAPASGGWSIRKK